VCCGNSTADQFGAPSYRDFLNRSMRIRESEIARCASAKLVEQSVSLNNPYRDVYEPAKIILRATKIIRSVGRPPSMINSIVAYVLARSETPYDWTRLFGAGHRHAEQMAIFLKQSREADIDAFMTRFDSFADNLTAEIFRRYCPGRIYPKYGSALKHPTLVALLPNAMKAFDRSPPTATGISYCPSKVAQDGRRNPPAEAPRFLQAASCIARGVRRGRASSCSLARCRDL